MQQDQTNQSVVSSANTNNRHDVIRRLVHDLRSPLTSLQLGLETVIDMTQCPETRHFLDQMLLDVHRLAAQMESASAGAKSKQSDQEPC